MICISTGGFLKHLLLFTEYIFFSICAFYLYLLYWRQSAVKFRLVITDDIAIRLVTVK